MEFSLASLCLDSVEDDAEGFVRPPCVSCSYPLPQLPAYQTVMTDNEVTISFSEEEIRDASSTIESEYVLNKCSHKVKNFVHDFTFGFFCKDTDIKISTYFPQMEPRFGNLTPDVMFLEGRDLFVVEFTTCKGVDWMSMQRAYKQKVSKYEAVLEESYHTRDTEPSALIQIDNVYFFIVVVGRNSIYTNLSAIGNDPSSGSFKELTLRFHLAIRIMDVFRERGIVKDEDHELTTEEFATIQWVRSIKIQPRNANDEFSVENYESSREPYNIEEVDSLIKNSLTRSKEEILANRKSDVRGRREDVMNHDLNCEYEKYCEAVKQKNPEGLRSNLKSIVNVPFFIVAPGSASLSIKTSLLKNYIGTSSDPTFKAWEEAKSNYFSYEDSYPDDVESDIYFSDSVNPIETLISTIQSIQPTEPKPSSNKSFYHRVPVKLDMSTIEELACLGVNGKKYKDNEIIKRHRLEKHKPFALETSTDDIPLFLDSDFESLMIREINSMETIKNEQMLINLALDLHGFSDLRFKHKETLTHILSTKFFSWCKMISDIATELSVSMKQHCKPNEFILKKLKDFEVFLLIKPTKSSEQCFFSVLVLNQSLKDHSLNLGFIFRPFKTNGTCSWTEFVSVNQSKLVNWTLLESRAIALVPYWLEFYSVPPFALTNDNLPEDCPKTKQICDSIKEAYKMVWLSVLVSLADKAEIEETLSLSRFMMMESFVSYPLVPRPQKMLEKFPTTIRSRLTLFIIKKLIELSKYIIDGKITESVESADDIGASISVTSSIRVWTGLRNWLTGFPLSNPGQVINLMYLGYIKNKNESTEVNTESKLLNKILTLEEKLTPEIGNRIGRVNKEFNSGTFHEYNIDFLKFACDRVKRKFSSKTNPKQMSDQISRTLLKKISSTPVEEVFMTLKASSNFDESYFIFADYSSEFKKRHKEMAAKAQKDYEQKGDASNLTNENFSRINAYYRSKIIEKSLPYVEGDKIMVRDILPICLEEVKSNGYMRICIFKKQQHGGLREIYVLNFAERVLQYFIEMAGRVLCDVFPGETMTHPDNKKKIPECHAKEVKCYFNKGISYTTFTSADSAKWNQNQYCHKFALMMVNMFNDDWHGLMWEVLQMWRNKYIKISDNLLNLFQTKINAKFHDEITNKMYRGYKGEEKISWIRKGHSYVKTRSGMMQGILHYVSSAFHSVINSTIEDILKARIPIWFPGGRITCTTMQSSDDSGMIVTINHSETTLKSKKTILCWLAVCHYFKCFISEEVAIKNSIKTTFHCSRVFEFNSKFYFANFHYEPDIKLAFASLLISQQENFIERQEEMYTLLTSFISTGGSFYSAFYVQCAQAFLFYRGLGSSVTTRFSLLSQCQNHLKDPSSGFFLMDNPLCPGMTGFSYNLWCALQSGRLSESYNDQLDRESDETPGSLETTSLGHLIRKAFITFGSSKKLEQMKRRMQVDNSWVDEMDANPELLFRNAKTTVEYKTKVGLKLSQRGVSTSLSTGVPITSIISSSVYVLNSAVFRMVDADESILERSTYKGETRSKASLLSLISQTLFTRGTKLSEARLKILFHKHNEYKDLKKRLDDMKNSQVQKKLRERRRIVTSLVVYNSDSFSNISKLSLLRAVWFPREFASKCQYPRRIIDEVFNNLRRNISWLSSNFHESLRDSPFVHAHQMVNWFQQLDSRTKVICLLGAPLSSRKGKSTVMAAITSNFGKFHSLSISMDDAIDSSSNHLELALHQLCGISTYPHRDRDRYAMLAISSINDEARFDPLKVKSRHNTLITMKEALKLNANRALIIDQILRNKIGYVGSWTSRQRLNIVRREYEGLGRWQGIICGHTVLIEVDSKTENQKVVRQMTKITVDHWLLRHINDFEIGLKNWMKDNNISPNFTSRTGMNEVGVVASMMDRVTDSGCGTPICLWKKEDPMQTPMDDGLVFEVRLTDFQSIQRSETAVVRLIARDYFKSYTLLSLTLYPSDWKGNLYHECDTFSSFGVLGDWLKGSSITLEKARLYISSLSKYPAIRSVITDNAKSWLYSNGFRPSYLKVGNTILGHGDRNELCDIDSELAGSRRAPSPTPSDEADEFEMDFLMDLADEINNELEDNAPALALVEDVEDNEFFDVGAVDLDDFGYYRESTNKLYQTVVVSNELMSSMAKQIIDLITAARLNTIFESKKFAPIFRSAMTFIKWLYPELVFKEEAVLDIDPLNVEDPEVDLGFY